ncbi:MAG: hypothetical protein FWF23_00830 [Alphaproteobacteria bacterium]|nr:hypothetical protein [Alphaproteobacteria bacterium]MCL2505751.1 hypothetical protein [Alphaproteobacteria bacterium]
MITINLKDSQSTYAPPVSIQSDDASFEPELIMKAAALLKKGAVSKKYEVYSLSPHKKSKESSPFLDCMVQDNVLKFVTYNFVGRLFIRVEGRDICFNIYPSMGLLELSHILSYSSGVYFPENSKPLSGLSYEQGMSWLLLLLWKCAFERALRQSSVPKDYVFKSENLKRFRGRLDLIKNIQQNLTDFSKVWCIYKPLSMDITINRTVRYIYKILLNSKETDKRFYSELSLHDQRLASFGVSNEPVSVEQINHIKYTKLNEAYRPLMLLSKALIRAYGSKDFFSAFPDASYVADVSEIQKMYSEKRRNITSSSQN